MFPLRLLCRVIALVVIATLLAACGNKGPLVKPVDSTAKPELAPPTPAPASTEPIQR